MSNTFKVSIPSGSLLEKELDGKKGRQRQQRLYFLAELGAEQLKGSGPSVTPMNDIKSHEIQKVIQESSGGVKFPEDDLLSM